MILRPYQNNGIHEIRQHLLAGRRSVLYVLPTGGGKTALTAHMIATAVSKGKRAWFCVHRRELLNQSVETLRDSANLDVGIIQAGHGSNGYLPAQVASINTLMRRWERYPLPDLLVIDEAHHCVSRSWSDLLRKILERSPKTRLIGLTATPCRLDGRGLGEWFETMVQGPSVQELIEGGYLSNYRLWPARLPDLSNIHTVAGDYNRRELTDLMQGSTVTGDALDEYRKHCAGMRALVFMWSIEASVDMAARFISAGIPAAHIDGETPDAERDSAMRRFRAGELKVISSVELFSEGLDVPAVEAGFLMRPTQSLGLYRQQVGRILRPFPGKQAALIFDHAGHTARHGLPDMDISWSLAGVDQATKNKKPVLAIKKCLKCYADWPVSVRVCMWCGTEFEVKPREVRQEAAELQEIDMDAMRRLFAVQRVQNKREQATAQGLEDLKRIERERGYKRGWAEHVLRARRDKLSKMADAWRPRGE